MANWNVGATVMLKSGGPVMTVVEGKRSDGQVLCQWFLDGTLQTAVFHPEAIEAYDRD